MGLALVRQIVKLSGGRLGVRSKVGEGSTFWVELPLGVGLEAVVPYDNDPLDCGSTASSPKLRPSRAGTMNRTRESLKSVHSTILDNITNGQATRPPIQPTETVSRLSVRSASALQNIMDQGQF